MPRSRDIGAALRERLAPLLFWLAACAAVAVMWLDVGTTGSVTAFATRTDVAIATLTPGRVAELLVVPGERVAAGQIVATLDPSPLEAELRVLEAERRQVEAALGQAQTEARRAGLGDVAATESAVAAAERELRAARADLQARRAELRATERELTRMRDLVERRLLTDQELSELTVQRARLAEEIREARATVALLEGQAEAARAQEGVAPDELLATTAAPLEAELRVLDAQLLLLRARRADLVLRAPGPGLISEVLVREGEVAEIAGPVARVVLDNHGRITACVPEDQLGQAVLGGGVEVETRPGGAPRWRGRAVVLGPVGELPARCWPSPREPRWGRAVEIELDAPATLIPGAPFNVRFLEPAAAPADAAAPT